MARYEGSYAIQAGARTIELRVFARDGKLMGQPDGQGVSELIRVAEHEFVVAAERGIRLVFSMANGRADSVALHQGGNVYAGGRR